MPDKSDNETPSQPIKFEAGDILVDNGVYFLIIRYIMNKGYVIGEICDCGAHLNKVFNEIYTWSDEFQTFLDHNNNPLQKNFLGTYQVIHGSNSGLRLAKKNHGVAISKDYPPTPCDEIATFIVDKYATRIDKAVEALRLGPDRDIALRRALEILGLSLTDEEAFALSVVFAHKEILEKGLSNENATNAEHVTLFDYLPGNNTMN